MIEYPYTGYVGFQVDEVDGPLCIYCERNAKFVAEELVPVCTDCFGKMALMSNDEISDHLSGADGLLQEISLHEMSYEIAFERLEEVIGYLKHIAHTLSIKDDPSISEWDRVSEAIEVGEVVKLKGRGKNVLNLDDYDEEAPQ